MYIGLGHSYLNTCSEAACPHLFFVGFGADDFATSVCVCFSLRCVVVFHPIVEEGFGFITLTDFQ